MKRTSFITIFFLLALELFAQGPSVARADSLSGGTEAVQVVSDSMAFVNTIQTSQDSSIRTLLPNHYLFTQKILWGENGLLRKTGSFPLTQEGRDREMDIRYRMNQLHQIAGLVSLAGMIGSGITGQRLYSGKDHSKSAHEAFVGLTNVSYVTSLGLGLFSPPAMKDRAGGLNALNIHKALSLVHIASMLTTNILAGMLEDNAKLVPYHRAAAITAFSSLLVATVVIKI
jgi:hypothetical protein